MEDSIKSEILNLLLLTGLDSKIWSNYGKELDAEYLQKVASLRSKTEKILDSLIVVDNKIDVNENNIEDILYIRDAIIYVNHYGSNSWNSGRCLYLSYKFFSYCFCSEKLVADVDFFDNETVCIINKEQILYYLFWREKANNREYGLCSHRLLWIYIIDLLFNTCIDDKRTTYASLCSIRDAYLDLVSDERRTELTYDKLYYATSSYVVYNHLWDITKESDFRFNDNYNYSLSISNGNYDGLGELLFSYSTWNVRTKAVLSGDMHEFLIKYLPIVFNKLHEFCINNSINLSTYFIGTLQKHCVWNPYNISMIHDEVFSITNESHVSFVYGKNKYYFVNHETTVKEKDNVNMENSWFHNDSGECTEKNGLYYRNQFSGITYKGKEIIDYVIRLVENYFRIKHGQKELQLKPYPFTKKQKEFNEVVFQSIGCDEIISNRGCCNPDFTVLSNEEIERIKTYPFYHKYTNNFYMAEQQKNNERMLSVENRQNYSNLFQSLPIIETNKSVRNCEEIYSINIERDFILEKSYGIEDLSFYFYKIYDELHMCGEIKAKSIKMNFSFSFTLYDVDGDIIDTFGNSRYSGHHSGPFYTASNTIRKDCFFDRYPFSAYFNIPKKTKVVNIRIGIDEEN